MSRVIDDFERRKLAVKKTLKNSKSQLESIRRTLKAKSSALPIECDMNLSQIVKRILEKQMTSPNDYTHYVLRATLTLEFRIDDGSE